MSKVTTFDQVRHGIVHYGERATVITIGDDGRPHVVTSSVAIVGDRLVVEVGSRTRANLERRPVTTLVWQPREGEEYLLIVDASAESIGAPDEHGVAAVTLVVEGGIQHRLAGLEPGASTCRAVDAVGR
jgi:hypothetical protein